jgi:hypothetical protein
VSQDLLGTSIEGEVLGSGRVRLAALLAAVRLSS